MDSSRGAGRSYGRSRGKPPLLDAPPARHPLHFMSKPPSQPQPADSSTANGRGRGRGRVFPKESVSAESIMTGIASLSVDSSAARGAIGGGGEVTRGTCRQRPLELVTRPPSLTVKQGTSGERVTFSVNYFSFHKLTDWDLFMYRIDYSPEYDSMPARKSLLKPHKELFGAYIFDGSALFCRTRLPNSVTEVVSEDKFSKSPVKITIKFIREVLTGDMVFLQLYNILLRKCLASLNLQLVGRDFFDADAKILIPNFRFEIWPGYLTSIRQCEDEVLLNVDISHKVMRQDTAYDLMRECRETGDADWKDVYLSAIAGVVIITPYNNKTYRVDDVDFSSSPKSTFNKKNEAISYVNYFKERYNINIHDHEQPLLISRPKARDIRGGRDSNIALIPELCCLTGLTDKMRSNFQLMKALSDHTRVKPFSRIKAIEETFMKRMLSTKATCEELDSWNVSIKPKLVTVQGRILDPEKIVHGNGQRSVNNLDGDFTKNLRNREMLSSVPLTEWALIYPAKFEREVHDFLRFLKEASASLNYKITAPMFNAIPNDRTSTYVQCIEKVVSSVNPLLVLCVVPNNRADRYQGIKKKCYVDRAVASQVVLTKNLNPRGALSIATKIVIQLNCKLGGSPWTVSIPFKDPVMFAGFDVCHDTIGKGRSYGALVASLTRDFTRMYSAVSHHSANEELSNDIAAQFQKAVLKFKEYNDNKPPNRIFFFRDGVGEGNYHYVISHEVNLIKEALKHFYDEEVKLAVIIVSKRVNARIFNNNDNPRPGAIVDSVITNPSCYDFYLVSQSVRQGTVGPTSYNVIYDTTNLSADQMQQLTYKMTHLYYNWSGTVSVPAPCQYAHKLAFLISQHLHRDPNRELEDKLFYL